MAPGDSSAIIYITADPEQLTITPKGIVYNSGSGARVISNIKKLPKYSKLRDLNLKEIIAALPVDSLLGKLHDGATIQIGHSGYCAMQPYHQ